MKPLTRKEGYYRQEYQEFKRHLKKGPGAGKALRSFTSRQAQLLSICKDIFKALMVNYHNWCVIKCMMDRLKCAIKAMINSIREDGEGRDYYCHSAVFCYV